MKVVESQIEANISINDVKPAHYVIGVATNGDILQLRQNAESQSWEWELVFSNLSIKGEASLSFSNISDAVRCSMMRWDFQVHAFNSMFEVKQFIANYGEQK